MSKELEKEYLEDLDHYDEGMGIHSTSYEKCKERLIRLAKIDNANPSEALKKLDKYLKWLERNEFYLEISDGEYAKCSDTIRQALQRLEAIDQSNPSEALECLETIAEKVDLVDKEYYWEVRNAYIKVEQALLKSQEQEKVLKIIKEKGLPLGEIDMIKQSANYNEYNIKVSWANFKNISIQKTEEEFELLKRYCE